MISSELVLGRKSFGEIAREIHQMIHFRILIFASFFPAIALK